MTNIAVHIDKLHYGRNGLCLQQESKLVGEFFAQEVPYDQGSLPGCVDTDLFLPLILKFPGSYPLRPHVIISVISIAIVYTRNICMAWHFILYVRNTSGYSGAR